MHNFVINSVEKHADRYTRLAQDIWNNPELGFQEVRSSKFMADALKEFGFETELGAYGIPTAIRAVWGSGHPVIGFCGEYDALPNLSQTVSTTKDPITPGAPGHGCGHNLLGTACLGAAVALKEYLEANGKEGTVVYYGCPAEELLVGKAFMAKEGAFAECDAAFSWHPASIGVNSAGRITGNNTAIFHFKGKSAHAAADPENGRSALDAVEIMNVGVQFLREHVPSDVRMHYTITDGGVAPNIVPDTSSVWYYVRALDRDTLVDAYNRVVKCAEGAAHMTDTELEVEFTGGIYPTMPNRVLVDLLQEKTEQIPGPTYTEAELEFARQINQSNPRTTENTPPIDTNIYPVYTGDGYASTDFGDVNHIVPSATLINVCSASMAFGHSWMITACSGHSIGYKGMLHGAKVLGAAACQLIDDPSVVAAAKAEFDTKMAGKKYVCPITDDVKKPF